MTHSILDNFDPFATHPFTNGSGLVPAPPMPSQYPISIPTSRVHHDYPTFSSPQSIPTSSSSLPSGSPQTPSFIKAPQPRHITSHPTQQNANQPIFVPFRHETSSPDLVLRKPKTSSFSDSYARRS